MKKLMLLGGSRYLMPVIDAAHKLGCYVITCDYLPDNSAHKYADEYCNVSIIDKEAVLNAARRLDIDGIMSFACDPGVVTAAYVAEKMGLPSCGPYESVCILQNKSKFREFLANHGFNVPKAKGYSSIEKALCDIENFAFPVIIKPTDSAGSKGVSRVDRLEELRSSIEHALSFSHCHEFIVEEFIEKKGCSSDSDCFSINGELKFVSYSNQYFDEQADNPYTPAAFSWPSAMSNSCQQELTSEIQRLLNLLHMKDSLYNIETREGVDSKAYIMEVSPRGGGNCLSEMLCYATGVDLITNAVRVAIGEAVIGLEQKPYKGYWAEVILHSERHGVFESIWLSDMLKDYVVEENVWIEKGSIVNAFTGANQSIGTLALRFDSERKMKMILESLRDHLKVVVK